VSPTLSFLRQALRNPVQTAAFWPSSQRLGTAMARQIPQGSGPVIELGAGTGAVTRMLLRQGVAASSLLAVEKNPMLCRTLEARFPEVRVAQGDACGLRALVWRAHAVQERSVRAVVSGLGIRAMGLEDQARICEEVFALLSADGILVQFTYGLRPPLDSWLQAEFGLLVRKTDVVLGNFPPAAVYVYSRSGDPAWAGLPQARSGTR
jgi:phosphatidylethanolamine/phosphatidyl-N-methylethanolamine N-methyltransferase